MTLWLKNGARNLSERIKAEWANDAGPADLLISVVPDLAEVLRNEIADTALCKPVSGLLPTISETSESVPWLMWKNVLLTDTEKLTRLSRAERLKLVVNEVAATGWLNCKPAEALELLGDQGVDGRRANVARGASLPERLLLAVGGLQRPSGCRGLLQDKGASFACWLTIA